MLDKGGGAVCAQSDIQYIYSLVMNEEWPLFHFLTYCLMRTSSPLSLRKANISWSFAKYLQEFLLILQNMSYNYSKLGKCHAQHFYN